MRRSRYGGHAGSEFPSSGEDSFVAVVVTKLTGALLFLLLLVMVIMALLPKAVDVAVTETETDASEPLAISTPGTLPEAIAGRPYTIALAATGASGPLRWSIDGELPDGLAFESETGLIRGTPRSGTPEPVELVLRVRDGNDRVSRPAQLVVYQPDSPLWTPSRWAPGLPPIPWQTWLEQGFGFLVLLLVHMVGINALLSLERRNRDGTLESATRARHRRFVAYRWLVRLMTLTALAGLIVWLWLQRHP